MSEGGRQAEFEALLRPHLAWLYRLAYRFTGHREDAEDLVQELLVRLYRNPSDLAQVDNPKPWLTRVMHNLFVDQWRHRKHTPLGHLHPDPWEDLFVDEAGGDDPERALELAGLRRDILAALYSLEHDYRALVVMHDMEGRSLPELAETLDMPLGTLKSRLFRARRKLRMRLRGGNPLARIDVIVAEV